MKKLLAKLKAGRKAKPASKAPAVRGPTITLFGLAGALLAFVALGALGAVQWLERQAAAAEARDRLEAAAAGRVADAYAARVQALSALVGRFAAQTSVAEALRDGDRTALATAGAELAALLPQPLGVRFITPADREPDYSRAPVLSYAGLDLARRIEAGEAAPTAEVHLFGGEHQQLVIARPVGDGEVAGTLLASLPVAWLNDNLRAPENGYAELVQATGKQVVLASAGNSGLRQGEGHGVPVAGTPWRARYWLPAAGGADWQAFAMPFAVAGVVLSLALVALFFGVSKLVRDDLVRFLRHFVVAQGGTSGETDVRLAEFKKAVRAMEQYMRTHRTSPTVRGSGVGRGEAMASVMFEDEPAGPGAATDEPAVPPQSNR